MSTSQDINIDPKIKQKRLFIILGAAAITLLLVLVVSTYIFNKAENSGETIVTKLTLCDLDSSELCVVTFGANNLNRMVINIQLPNADYPGFYIKGKNRGIINVYSCETISDFPTSAYCTGTRTPLGESIELEVYSTDGDTLLAHGTFIVSAILLSTPADDSTSSPEDGTPRPTRTPTITPESTQTESISTPEITSEPTSDNAYPNPTSETGYQNP